MTGSSGLIARTQLEHPREDPTLERAAASLVSLYRVLGFNLRVETNDARIQAAADGRGA